MQAGALSLRHRPACIGNAPWFHFYRELLKIASYLSTSLLTHPTEIDYKKRLLFRV
jgi:hypothetical protein